jgi:oxygen-independent coproporphyrinogen-3 oxidase
MKNIGVYIHIPFCIKKCLYCDFISYSYNKLDVENYIEYLLKEIEYRKNQFKDYMVDTIYFGGGTPSLLSVQEMNKIINHLFLFYKVSENVEITVECNPNTLNLEKLAGYKKCLVNRISMGVQSFDNLKLKELGRQHNVEDVKNSLKWVNKSGFDNISIDMMFGLPNQNINDVNKELDYISSIENLNHISYYSLTIMENTPFGKMNIEKIVPEDYENRKMYYKIIERLSKIDIYQYEISNFSKIGYESKHNLKYWELGPYIGFGVAAHSFYDNKRTYNKSKLIDYFNQLNKSYTEIIDEVLTPKDSMAEYMMLGFRLNKGIDINNFKRKYNMDIFSVYNKEIEDLINQKLIVKKENSLISTAKGIDYMNIIGETFL